MAWRVSDDVLQKLQAAFQECDANGDGTITLDEIEGIAISSGIELDVKKIVHHLNVGSDDSVSFIQFMKAVKITIAEKREQELALLSRPLPVDEADNGLVPETHPPTDPSPVDTTPSPTIDTTTITTTTPTPTTPTSPIPEIPSSPTPTVVRNTKFVATIIHSSDDVPVSDEDFTSVTVNTTPAAVVPETPEEVFVVVREVGGASIEEDSTTTIPTETTVVRLLEEEEEEEETETPGDSEKVFSTTINYTPTPPDATSISHNSASADTATTWSAPVPTPPNNGNRSSITWSVPLRKPLSVPSPVENYRYLWWLIPVTVAIIGYVVRKNWQR